MTPASTDAEAGERAHQERELKFSPGPSFQVPDLADPDAGIHTAPGGTIGLHAVYFDTADLRLSRAGASLRHREDGWTVKLPAAGDGVLTRDEIPVAGPPGDPPEAAVDLVHALIRSAPLLPAARIDTVRRRCLLQTDGDEQLAEVVDDDVTVLDGVRIVARFREIEVEFTDVASRATIEQITDRMEAAGAGPVDPVPKIVRALGARALDPPDLAPPPKVDFASTARDVLRAAVASSAQRLVAHDPGVRLGTDAEMVHQARVATRRLRSDLRTFAAVVDPEWEDSLRAELKWIGERLGAVRDTDVLLERFERRLADVPGPDVDAGERLLEGLREHRARARDDLLAAMRSDRYLALLDRLVEASHVIPPAPDDPNLDLELGDLVVKPWRKLRKAVEELGDDPPDPALHAVRIRAKRCRYAAEAVAAAVGKPAWKFARAVAALQEVLGEHQDAVVAQAWLRDHATATGTPTDAAFVAGEIAAQEAVAAEASRAEWHAVWKRARAKRLRDWL